MADFTTGASWTTLIAVFLFVVPDWASIKTWGNSFLTQQYYEDLLEAARNRSGGSLIVRSSVFLWIMQIIRNIALWLTWTFVILQNAYPDGTLAFTTFYIVINSLVFAGTVFHVGCEAAFWQAGWFGFSFALRIIEVLIFIAAAILETILVANNTPDSGWDIAFLVVLWIIVAHGLFVLLPRSWILWAAADEVGRNNEALGSESLIPSAAKIEQGGQQQRAMAAMHAAAINTWQKPAGQQFR